MSIPVKNLKPIKIGRDLFNRMMSPEFTGVAVLLQLLAATRRRSRGPDR
jgi:hypothetical protein